MSPVPSRRELRARRRALRRELASRRREALQRVQGLPAVQRARWRRRLQREGWALVLLLILFFARCECGPQPPPPEPPPPPDAGQRGLSPIPLVRANPTKLHADSTRVNRAKLSVPAPPPASWLDELHLQVSARGPRMARCFAGASGPGALRWTVSLDAASGTVSDQDFELVGTGADLSSTARDCLGRILASPAYHFTAAKDQPIPQRISMVIEF